MVKIFKREYGLFMTFLQFFGYAACAALRRTLHGETDRKIPLSTYFGLGFLQVCVLTAVAVAVVVLISLLTRCYSLSLLRFSDAIGMLPAILESEHDCVFVDLISPYLVVIMSPSEFHAIL